MREKEAEREGERGRGGERERERREREKCERRTPGEERGMGGDRGSCPGGNHIDILGLGGAIVHKALERQRRLARLLLLVHAEAARARGGGSYAKSE